MMVAVEDAARQLSISESAVRQQLRNGALEAASELSSHGVNVMGLLAYSRRHGKGRPLSQQNAWLALEMLQQRRLAHRSSVTEVRLQRILQSSTMAELCYHMRRRACFWQGDLTASAGARLQLTGASALSAGLIVSEELTHFSTPWNTLAYCSWPEFQRMVQQGQATENHWGSTILLLTHAENIPNTARYLDLYEYGDPRESAAGKHHGEQALEAYRRL